LVHGVEGFQGVLFKLSYAVRILHAQEVDKQVGGCCALGGGWFGGADGHFTVELPAVGRQDGCAKALGDGECGGRFAGGGGAGDDEEVFGWKDQEEEWFSRNDRVIVYLNIILS